MSKSNRAILLHVFGYIVLGTIDNPNKTHAHWANFLDAAYV